jgi:mannosyl-3-phosphoglycerate phosphatase
LRSNNTVVFCAIDDMIPVTGNPLSGFPEFLEGLTEAGIPCVWITSRNRHQLDSTLRRLGHSEPFIAEGGCCVYIAEDYFHLKPAKTIRLGRFIAIPAAKPLPAAAEALETVSEETGITVVPLRSLSPRELIQNTGLARNEADLVRQRDFDELFFFAGASDADIQRFQQKATHLKFSVRPIGSLWSLAVQPSLGACVRELKKLYERTFHKAAFTVGIATASVQNELFPGCDRNILLTSRQETADSPRLRSGPPSKTLPLFGEDTWTEVLEVIKNRSF